MQTEFLDNFAHRAKQQPQTIVLPEGTDPRILEAAAHCARQGLARPIVLGISDEINAICKTQDIDPDGITIVDPCRNEQSASYAELLYELRKAKGMTMEQASTLITQPIVFANCMVRAGDADGCVAGAQHATSDVVRAALQIIGVAPGVKLVSSFFIMVLSDACASPVVFADCALNIAPNAEQLADIAASSAQSAAQLLGFDPKIAMLSFSTNASAAHPEVDKVRNATALVKERHPSLQVIGDIQFDAAFSAKTLTGKWPEPDFDAPANVFVFPSLEAGNIGYKIAERLGGALPIGPVLQGLNQPVNDLSRGCDVAAVINTIIVTAVQSQQR
jgi:phosphate acetyltransferase